MPSITSISYIRCCIIRGALVGMPKARRSRRKKIKFVDPFYKGPRRDLVQSDKYDLKPVDPDVQPIPRRLQQMMEPPTHRVTKDDDGEGDYLPLSSKKHTQKTLDSSSITPGGQEAFERRQGEGVRAYLDRIDRETNDRLMEEYKKTRIKSERRRKYSFQRKKKSDLKKKGGLVEDLQEVVKDEVKFGEVVQAPPHLTSAPRRATSSSKAQKAMSLKLVKGNPLMQQELTTTQCSKKVVGLEEQRRKKELEVERQKVVEAYRRMRERTRTKH